MKKSFRNFRRALRRQQKETWKRYKKQRDAGMVSRMQFIDLRAMYNPAARREFRQLLRFSAAGQWDRISFVREAAKPYA